MAKPTLITEEVIEEAGHVETDTLSSGNTGKTLSV